MNGYRHLSDRYTAWPAVVHDGEIDLANPATSPLNMVVARFHLDPLQHLNFLDAKWCQDRGFLLIDFKGEAERKIKNELWNRLICASREKALSSYPEEGVKILFLAAA